MRSRGRVASGTCHSVADPRRACRRFYGRALRAGGQGARRARGDGRDLLSARQHSRRRRHREVARLGAFDRQRGRGRARGTDHSDRLGPGFAFARAQAATWQKITLLSAGAGAGIAATFNTPLGGVLFAVEILLPEVSNRTFLPVVIATGSATLLGRILIGPNPAFAVPDLLFPAARYFGLEEAVAFVALGALCGVAAWAFIRLLVFMEDGFPKLAGKRLHPEYRRHDAGRADDGRPHACVRPFLCRRRRLRRHSVDPRPRHDCDLVFWRCCSSSSSSRRPSALVAGPQAASSRLRSTSARRSARLSPALRVIFFHSPA